MSVLSFAPGLLDELAARAEASYPEECCGALLGRRAATAGIEEGTMRVVEVVSSRNAAPDPTARYAIAPPELLELHRAARRAGLDVIGYYHSHPTADATPSASDRADAWPELAYVIIPVGGGTARPPRGWWFPETGEPLEVAIEIAAPEASTARGEPA